MRHWWGGDIERRVGGSGLFERVEHRIDAPFARQRFGARAIMIVQPGNGETCLAIGRQMRVLDDPAGAEDRKSFVSGKSVSVRVNLVCLRIINKKQLNLEHCY